MSNFKTFLAQVLALTRQKLSEKDGAIISDEYKILDQAQPAPGNSWGQHDAMVRLGLCQSACDNPQKNRYCNLFPFDEHLVRLHDPNAYINASWINLDPWLKHRKFIITMGPMHPSSYSSRNRTDFDEEVPANTCPDFWQMIWETNAKVIVMLCRVTQGFTGCSQYFPDLENQEAKHGSFQVKTAKVKDESYFIERDLQVSLNNETRLVKHLQFLDWPNYGVPDAVEPIGKFIMHCHKIATSLQNAGSELVVHCSGGIGRSGTFLAAYGAYDCYLNLKNEAKHETPTSLSLLQAIQAMRQQRHPWMVEGEHQYFMAYKTSVFLLESIL